VVFAQNIIMRGNLAGSSTLNLGSFSMLIEGKGVNIVKK